MSKNQHLDAHATLAKIGWRTFFAEQLSADELTETIPARVIAVHRSELDVIGAGFEAVVHPPRIDDEEARPTIGDWILLEKETNRVLRRLDRYSVFKRKAPGSAHSVQLIAANVDTLMIVSSCNDDFNVARLERYLAVAREAGVTPIVILTKADLCDAPDHFRVQAEKLMPNLIVEALDAKNASDAAKLKEWCGQGQTVAFVGSSGVGKSTLTNSLLGDDRAATQDIRLDDAKGRHTTTHRALYQLPSGGWILDTPGVRELQLTDVADGLSDLFGDLEELVSQCRFGDCKHETEPGCAVSAAINAGIVDRDRFERWQKLVRENECNTLSVAKMRARDKTFTKKVKEAIRGKSKKR